MVRILYLASVALDRDVIPDSSYSQHGTQDEQEKVVISAAGHVVLARPNR